jgi:hypothetical protein
MVEFYVVLKADLLPVTTSDNARMGDIFLYLKSESHAARLILGRTLFHQYHYFKLKNPVPIPRRDINTTTIVQTSLDRNNWEQVSPHSTLDVLGPMLSNNYVYMVIQPREGELSAYPSIYRSAHLLLQLKRGKQLPISTQIMQIYLAACRSRYPICTDGRWRMSVIIWKVGYGVLRMNFAQPQSLQ